jgi:hypothetical protein
MHLYYDSMIRVFKSNFIHTICDVWNLTFVLLKLKIFFAVFFGSFFFFFF